MAADPSTTVIVAARDITRAAEACRAGGLTPAEAEILGDDLLAIAERLAALYLDQWRRDA